MSLFRDRAHAGILLADALAAYAGKPDAIILALPRGGVVVGAVVAHRLQLPLDLVVPRKIGAPGNAEYAIGAIAESGEPIWDEAAIEATGASAAYRAKTVAAEREESARRLRVYRGERPPRQLKGKTVVLIDDGIATGLTVRAAIRTIRAERPARIVLAVPVAPPDVIDMLRAEVDEVICLQKPLFLGAIGAYYDQFAQTTDEEVVALLAAADHLKP